MLLKRASKNLADEAWKFFKTGVYRAYMRILKNGHNDVSGVFIGSLNFKDE